MDPAAIWTIGHSTRPLEAFIDLLRGSQIALVADVRRYPASRMHPHFNAALLAASLGAAGMRYEGFADLGGRRVPRPGSVNTRWRNASFRGYADYMQTVEFDGALTRLLAAAEGARTAIMCAEAPWWRCHRALIADALKARGIEVMHIMGLGKSVAHSYTSAASVVDGNLCYGPAPGLFG
ncbi:MAG: DUF488 domain-containing protein [Pseudomonadota bacterium]|nr:DUF488 domain-containing protein [Pseudomonadota bacterium]